MSLTRQQLLDILDGKTVGMTHTKPEIVVQATKNMDNVTSCLTSLLHAWNCSTTSLELESHQLPPIF